MSGGGAMPAGPPPLNVAPYDKAGGGRVRNISAPERSGAGSSSYLAGAG